MRRLKLIWDFRGPDSKKIAEHHEIHLKEYILAEQLELNITGVIHLTDMHAIAYMVVHEEQMRPIRDALKPHRGQIYDGV
jgi:bacillopeptidase F (M6 metalloprotease family)